MSEALEQSDLDALMDAVEDGDVLTAEGQDAEAPLGDAPGLPGMPGAGPPATIFSRHRRDLEDLEIRDYDFKRPERISTDQMRALRTLHDAFARSFGASLSGLLRTIVEVSIASAEQMTYSEFITGLPNPTSFNLVEADDLEGQLCLELSPLIIYPIIDRLLGGTNQDLFIPQRPMTMIEQRLVRRLLDLGMGSLNEAWASVRPFDFHLGEMESNPQIVQIVPPNEVVAVISFEIKMTSRAGTMSLCLPFNVIEPVIEDLSAQNWFLGGQEERRDEWREQIAGRINAARIQVEGVLAETTMTLDDLRQLEVGDLIVTETAADALATLTAEGVPKYRAHIGQSRGRKALRIAGPADSDA